MQGLTAKTLCIYEADITYFTKYACISTAASLSNLQAKILKFAKKFPVYFCKKLFRCKSRLSLITIVAI